MTNEQMISSLVKHVSELSMFFASGFFGKLGYYDRKALGDIQLNCEWIIEALRAKEKASESDGEA